MQTWHIAKDIVKTVSLINSRYVFCLKWGDKYGPNYVNNLYNMVERNLSLPYTFVCFTEDPTGLNPNIVVQPLPDIKTSGWWFKTAIFGDLGFKGVGLFIDLDVVIYRNIDKFFEYSPGDFCIIRDFNRYNIKNIVKMNSSVFRLNLNSLHHVYNTYKSSPEVYNTKFKGDQEFIESQIKKYVFWPDEWIRSYKWEMRDKRSMVFDGSSYRFTAPVSPSDFSETSIAVFHGTPNPHECADPWVLQHWH